MDPTVRRSTTSTTTRGTDYRTTAGGSGELLVVIGDSITNEGRIEIADVFGRERQVVIDGRPGFLIGEQLATASSLASMRPQIAIINLGTNDAVFAHDSMESVADLRRLVGAFGSARCIVLMTVNTHLPRPGASARAGAINDEVRTIAASDRRVRVIDLDALVEAAESDADFMAPFMYDSIHPTAAGQSRIAAAYVSAVATCPT